MQHSTYITSYQKHETQNGEFKTSSKGENCPNDMCFFVAGISYRYYP